ncbi:TetR/AcrR family transcriptional regulator [Rhizobium binxianense]
MVGGRTLRTATDTRHRILDAAVLRFSRHSYEETGLRDIAADVGVDVSYVHRCFGSKRQLFAEVLRQTACSDHILSESLGRLTRTLARQVLANGGAGNPEKVTPLDIVIPSLSSPDVKVLLQTFVLNDVVLPLSERIGHSAGRSAALVTAFLVGLGIVRNVLEIEVLLEPEGGELEKMIVDVINNMVASAPMDNSGRDKE